MGVGYWFILYVLVRFVWLLIVGFNFVELLVVCLRYVLAVFVSLYIFLNFGLVIVFCLCRVGLGSFSDSL